MLLSACSDNSSGPADIPTGDGAISYETTNGSPTISGSYSLSGMDMCQNINENTDTQEYFENLDAPCVIAYHDDEKTHVLVAEPAGENSYNMLDVYFPEASNPSDVSLSGCESTDECGVFYGENITSMDNGLRTYDQRVDLGNFNVQISAINDSRIEGQFSGNGTLSFSDENRESRQVSASGTFDIPIYQPDN